MDRIQIAQDILTSMGGRTYLEIGVASGASFIPIKARRKWGVDPGYTLTRRRRSKYAVFSFLGITIERLFRVTSDDFFLRNEALLASRGIDVCLVDGLHTYEQSLKDVLNALKYLTPKGVILVHDCNPSTELIARPASAIEELIHLGIPDWDGAWSGDVWKTIVHLRALRDYVDAFVLDCDTGIGIVTRRCRKGELPYSETDIHAMDYSYLSKNREALLGLQPSEYFKEFLHSHIMCR
jgi:hypothetical protein